MYIIFKALSDRIKNKLPCIQWIDWDTNQPDREDESFPLLTPAALIKIANISYLPAAGKMLKGSASINIRLVLRLAGNTHATAPDQENSLQQLLIISDLIKHLHCFHDATS